MSLSELQAEIRQRYEAEASAGLQDFVRGATERARARLAEDGPLPGDWKAHTDPASGKTYYYSTAENRTTWTRPQPPPRADAADGAAPPAVEDAAGRPIDL